MLVSELKGLDQTQGLLNTAADWEVVDGDLSQGAIRINDEQTPEMEQKTVFHEYSGDCVIGFN